MRLAQSFNRICKMNNGIKAVAVLIGMSASAALMGISSASEPDKLKDLHVSCKAGDRTIEGDYAGSYTIKDSNLPVIDRSIVKLKIGNGTAHANARFCSFSPK